MSETELKLGKMTRAELAEWFGIKPRSYDNAKAKKLKELQIFADFEEVYGGVNIIKIKIPIYAKKGSRAYNIIKEAFPNAWHKSGYDTAARVGSQIWRQNLELQDMITETTAKSYVSRVRTEYYGRVHKQETGSLGWCKYAYVVENCWEEAVLLTEEQSAQVNQLIYEIYTNEQEPFVYEAYKEGTISEKEYEEFQLDWKNKASDRYITFIDRLSKMLGFYPTKVTKITNTEKLKSAF